MQILNMHKIICSVVLILAGVCVKASPVEALIERLSPGSSARFSIRIEPSDRDYFELRSVDSVVIISANNHLSAATGLNWYLKYYAGIHICWNQLQVDFPDQLPPIEGTVRKECSSEYRYYLNYCTFGYSAAFWDWSRWQKEIDWMALHGVNLVLTAVGTANVWYNTLLRLGMNREDIDSFIAGPAYQPWMLMNNLEGWCGPNSENWYESQRQLQQKILERMREFGMKPVFPGYSGMIPSGSDTTLGIKAQDSGKWISFQRPWFILPSDDRFAEIASIYYEEQDKLYGKAEFYSMDPFHEMNPTPDNKQDIAPTINFAESGKAIMAAMKQHNPDSKWVIQGWMENPLPALIEPLEKNDLLILDLNSDCCPQWGTNKTQWPRENGYGKFPWLYCMLHNFGGAVGMFGKLDEVINGYYDAMYDKSAGRTLSGIGATMEAIENNPVVYELLFELPWRGAERFSQEDWLREYVFARYGKCDVEMMDVWKILGRTVYASRYNDQRVVSAESSLTNRPGVSCEGAWSLAYDPAEVVLAAEKMLQLADRYPNNDNYEYDVIDLVRQTLSDKALGLYSKSLRAIERGDLATLERLGGEYLATCLDQDALLATRKEFMVGNWIAQARKNGVDDREKALMELNARRLITVWGTEEASGTLHDYSHREWSGILRDLYYPRWKAWFEYQTNKLRGVPAPEPDYYTMERIWSESLNPYPDIPQPNAVHRAMEIFNKNFNK